MLIDHDLHIHTTLSLCCDDSAQTPTGIVRRCEELNLSTIGFTDHLWQNPRLSPDAWYAEQGPVRLNRLIDELSEITSPLRILRGCEADTIAPGKFSITHKFAETVDYVILAANHFHMKNLVLQPQEQTPAAVGRHLLLMFLSAVNSGLATVIPHVLIPMGLGIGFDQAIAAISETQLLDAFGQAAQRKVAIEITPAYFPPEHDRNRPAWSVETPLRILATAKNAGCRFVFGSDSHSLCRLELIRSLDFFVRQLDLTEKDIHPVAAGKPQASGALSFS